MRIFAAFIGFGRGFLLDPIRPAGPHCVCKRDLSFRVAVVPDLAVRKQHIAELGTCERRFRGLLRQLQELLLHRAARAMNGGAHGRGGKRAAFDRRIGQAGIAELHRHAFEGHSQQLGADLRHHRIGSGADIGGCARDLDAAVGGKHRAGARLQLHRLPDAARHAPTDKVVALAH